MVSLFWSARVGQSGCFVLIRTGELNGVGVGILKKQYDKCIKLGSIFSFLCQLSVKFKY